jgi:hypothetical protein
MQNKLKNSPPPSLSTKKVLSAKFIPALAGLALVNITISLWKSLRGLWRNWRRNELAFFDFFFKILQHFLLIVIGQTNNDDPQRKRF